VTFFRLPFLVSKKGDWGLGETPSIRRSQQRVKTQQSFQISACPVFCYTDAMSDTLHIVCPACASVNRLPSARLTAGPKCGRCKGLLFEGRPVELTGATFERHVSSSDIPVVVDFWAAWCGPCKIMAPAFAGAAARLEPRVRFAKLNTERNRRSRSNSES